METIKENNKKNTFQEKVEIFIKQNSIKDKSLKLLNSSSNGIHIMNEYNFEILGEEILNAILTFDKEILNVLYFETSNGKNKNNKTSKTITLPGAGRFSIHNFILIAKEKGLKQLIFDIMESELGFYEKILDELKNYNLIKNVNIVKNKKNDYFIINLK